MKNVYLLFFILFHLVSKAQVPVPAAPQKGPLALRGATVHVGDGTVIENGVVTIVDGKLDVVADATLLKMDFGLYEVIDVVGKHIYPGLILPFTNLGLEEIPAVRATKDHSEVGALKPNVRSLIAYNTDSEVIPTMKFNGILLAQPTPRGGLICGTSSIVKLDAWNWEDAAYRIDDGIHINWPSKTLSPKWWLRETVLQENPHYKKSLDQLKQIFADALVYSQTANNSPKNLKLESMRGLFDGSKTLYINANKRAQMVESVQWAKQLKLPKVVLVGARESYLAIDFLKEQNISILLTEVHRLPDKTGDDIDIFYKLPALLHRAGITVGLTYFKLQSSRNLPFFAGTVATYGLDKEEALRLVTSNTAKILGIDHKTGTLVSGKDANLVVSKGDLLDMRTNIVEMAFIEGRRLNLEGKQQRLYQRFKEKYGK